MARSRRIPAAAAVTAAFVIAPVVAAGVIVAGGPGAARAQAAVPAPSIPAGTLGIKPGAGFLTLDGFRRDEARIGGRIGWTVQMADRTSPEVMMASVQGQLVGGRDDLAALAGEVRLVMSVPLGFGKDLDARTDAAGVRRMLQSVASGRYDHAYRAVARNLVAGGHPDAVIRLGWEFDGVWSPWSAARGNHDAYVAAFRHVHGVFRGVSAAFAFDWCSMRLGWEETGRLAYPGDEYVDVISMDVYWRPPDGGGWDERFWARVSATMDDHQAFAAERGKPVAYPEWALDSADEPRFIEAMWAQMAELPDAGPGSLLYQSYFDVPGEYALAGHPRSQARYVELFASTAGAPLGAAEDPDPDDDPDGDPAGDPPGPPPPVDPTVRGYVLVDAGGRLASFNAPTWSAIPAAVVDMDGHGGGLAAVDGAGTVHVRSFPHRGDRPVLRPGERVSAISITPTGRGYWLFTDAGRALTYGDAVDAGDLGALVLNGPVIDAVATPSGRGYWMVGADGGVFAFGDAAFHGSMGGVALNAPVRALVPDPDGTGYWLVGADGGVFAFDAPFRGSMGGRPLNAPVVGMVSDGDGYLMVAADGGVFAFSDGPFLGSMAGGRGTRPWVALVSV